MCSSDLNLSKLETTLPKIKIPEILKEHEKEEKIEIKIKENQYDETLEKELQDIQNQLSKLSK